MRKFPTVAHKKLFQSYIAAQWEGPVTHVDFAKKLGCSTNMISFIFRGLRNVRDEKIRERAFKYYAVPVADWDKQL